MRAPLRLLRAGAVQKAASRGAIHEWSEGPSLLVLEEVVFRGTPGAVLCYDNPPVHQIGNPGLDAMIEALSKLEARKEEYAFLLLTWPCDPVHAGGDLKESLVRLEATRARRAELEASGATDEEVEALYGWADGRLDKGQALYRLVRRLGRDMRTVAVCGGGMRYGGSAEVNLMADWLVGDSRSGMCFSEAMIGLIPGWSGVGRAVTKAGAVNARLMAQTAREVRAGDLLDIGVYDAVVEVGEPLPRMGRSGDAARDRAEHARALVMHDDAVWPSLVLTALELATSDERDLPHKPRAEERKALASRDEVLAEVARRADPATYSGLWGKPLAEAKDALALVGRPLAPQSVAALDRLLEPAETGRFAEDELVEDEKRADARLYRDPRLEVGIRATLEQKVADFRA